MQKKKSINKMFLTIIGILLAIIFVAPILILVNSSFKTLQEIYFSFAKTFLISKLSKSV